MEEPRYYKIYCSKCRHHTKHKINDNNPTQSITCLECDKTRADHIVSKRVKIEVGLWNEYIGKCREQGINTEE